MDNQNFLRDKPNQNPSGNTNLGSMIKKEEEINNIP